MMLVDFSCNISTTFCVSVFTKILQDSSDYDNSCINISKIIPTAH